MSFGVPIVPEKQSRPKTSRKKARQNKRYSEQAKRRKLKEASIHRINGLIIDGCCRFELLVGHPARVGETPIRVSAVIDTGCTATSISQHTRNRLGLKPVDITQVMTADGKRNSEVVYVSFGFWSNKKTLFFGNHRMPVVNTPGVDILIGMNLITQGSFSVNGHKSEWTWTLKMKPKSLSEPIIHLPVSA